MEKQNKTSSGRVQPVKQYSFLDLAFPFPFSFINLY